MVYHGHPSRGCYACRRKKIRCDETRPQCSRCTKVGNVCPGYRSRDGSKFEFVVLSAATYKASRPNEPSTQQALDNVLAGPSLDFGLLSQDDSDSYSEDSTGSSSSGSSMIVSVSQSPVLPWEGVALPLFFNLFTASDAYQYQGFMPKLPGVYSQSSATSPLHLAVSAAVEANAVRKLTGDDAMTEARRKYSLAIRAVQRALEDPVEAVTDATLFSLVILTLFEFISGDIIPDHDHGAHISGYEALLSLRARNAGRSNADYNLFLAVATQVLVKHVRFRTAPSPHAIEVLERLQETDPTTLSVRLKLKVSIFNARAIKILQDAELFGKDQTTLWEILDQAELLVEESTSWPNTDQPSWGVTVVNTPLKDWSGVFHIYGTLAAANTWNMYRCAVIMLLITALQSCKLLLEAGEPPVLVNPSVLKARAKVATLLEDIVASFPYCLGRGDSNWSFPISGLALSGWALLWPAGLVARVPMSTREQKLKAISCFGYVGQAFGLQRAITLQEILLKNLDG